MNLKTNFHIFSAHNIAHHAVVSGDDDAPGELSDECQVPGDQWSQC